MRITICFFVFSIVTGCVSHNTSDDAAVILLSDTVDMNGVVESYTHSNRGGNTSVAHDHANIFKWSGESPYTSETFGYFTPEGIEIPYIKRDRDLGQVFTYPGDRAAKMRSFTVRLGFGTNVVRPGAFGAAVSMQLFEVFGDPVLNNNGSDSTMKALHGFPHDRYTMDIPHSRDDYFTGLEFKSLAVVRGYKFPELHDFGLEPGGQIDPNHEVLKGKFLTFTIPSEQRILLEPGKRYAFLIMIDSIGHERGFTLGNEYTGSYSGGHSIRRDGSSVFPPVPADPLHDFTHPNNKEALETAHFPADFEKRIQIPPGTRGYPDVDTWRDLEFYVRVEN